LSTQNNISTDKTQNISHAKEENLSFELLLKVYLAMALGFLLLLPMIHIKNQIYYYSRDISSLWSEYSILMEENRDLLQKIETIRFKQKVLDTLEIE
jgi:cell division protein FtsL